MTESEWLICVDPQQMLRHLGRATSAHKVRRLYTACCHRLRLTTAEQTSRDERRASLAGPVGMASPAAEPENASVYVGTPLHACEDMSPFLAEAAGEAVRILAAKTEGRLAVVSLIRDIFGNPFRPVAIDPAWLNWKEGVVPKLARAIYDDRAFDRLPLLADALEDGGCTDADILGHLRSDGPHVRGCWPVDLLLRQGVRRRDTPTSPSKRPHEQE